MNELPYWPSGNGNGSVGSYTRNGYGRLYVYEADDGLDPQNNTSVLTIVYQAQLSRGSGSFTRGGYISVDGDEKACSGSRSLTTTGSWVNVQTWTWTVPHEPDGSKTVTITTRGGYGGGPSLYVGSGTARYANCVGAGTFTFELTNFNTGAKGTPVYIGGAAYDAYIGDGAAWVPFDPVIM